MAALGDVGAFWRNGPRPGQFYNFPGNESTYDHQPARHTMQPIMTGTSVLGVKFDGGVMLAADMLGSYGSLARYRDLPRIVKVNDKTLVGASGDYADFQFLTQTIEQQVIAEQCLDDGFGYSPKSLHSWVTRVMYNRRTNFNPLWNTYIVAGLQDDQPYLGYVDKIGVAFQADLVATGYGAYIALPLLRERVDAKQSKSLTREEAREMLDECMKILWYRDARSFNKYLIGTCTKDGVTIDGPNVAKTNWEIAKLVKGYE
ncbi:proteasome subunit beta type-4-like [Tubulanus polymorphus]|uniref:proteasome subunit beta type-4-like n=1 Tax=Tubulanus polymorphus TaxID=672921 RepID=UPI003DA33888